MAQRRFHRDYLIRTKKLSKLWRRRGWSTLLTASGVIFLIGAGTVLWWSKDLPNPQNINDRRVTESTKIYDRTGQHILYQIGDVHRTVVGLDQISRFIRQATLAAEDDQFYQHHGLDFKGISRGVILKPLTGQRVQGGSTITQQLIKNSILTPERTIRRKVKEAVLAIELEQRFSKDQIFEMYLNDIPYGSQAYGVEAGATTFFNKSAADVSLGEAAILAALPKAPTYYSPFGSRYEELKKRQEFILQRMADLKMISQEQADAAKVEELQFEKNRESLRAPHFVFYVREILDEIYGERVVEQGGLTIITSLDLELQSIAEEVLKENTDRLKKLGASNAALVALDPKNGDILAMAGSLDYFNEEIDGNVNVTIRHRSPGSSIKPFVYAAAFQKGYTPDTVLIDAETDFGQGYKPKNYNLKTNGPVTMRLALANSLNIPAVKTLYLAGVREATNLAQAMGMTSLNDPDRYGLSLVLGGGEIRLLDEVSAYGVFANDGVRFPHRGILRVSDKENTLFDIAKEEINGEQVIDSQISRLITNILSDNGARSLVFGTNTPLVLPGREVAAKTGTTQEFRDGWTIGYTPSLAAGVWVGNNDNSPMNQKSDSGLTAAPLWNAFMRRGLAGQPIEKFVAPNPITNITNGVLRNEIPELKGKWDKNTNTVYSLECPVALGIPKTFKEIHNILFYVKRNDPRGLPPANAESDPQFDRWESAVQNWLEGHNEKTKDDPQAIRYGRSLPTVECTASNPEDLPNITIVEPATTIVQSSPINVTIAIDSPKPIKEIRYLWNGEEVAKRGPDESRSISFSFPENFSGRKTLLILAVTEDNFVGRAHRTFIINPDANAPSVTLHTPKSGDIYKQEQFPITVKVTAKDDSGIELVDVLYTKEGQPNTKRIGRTSQLHPSIPNRYEIPWPDSAGPGVYEVYAVVYDVTGNFTETDRQIIIVE